MVVAQVPNDVIVLPPNRVQLVDHQADQARAAQPVVQQADHPVQQVDQRAD